MRCLVAPVTLRAMRAVRPSAVASESARAGLTRSSPGRRGYKLGAGEEATLAAGGCVSRGASVWGASSEAESGLTADEALPADRQGGRLDALERLPAERTLR